MNIIGLNNGNKLTASDLYDTTQSKTQADFNASLKSSINSANSSLSSLNSSLTFNTQICFHMACCSTGKEAALSGILKLTNTIVSAGNAYNSSTGLFTCPVKGLYFVSFNYFSPQATIDTLKRPSIYKNSAIYIMGNNATQSLSTVVYCYKGETLAVGCYMGSLNIFEAYGHIEGVFVLLQPLP